MKKIKAGIIGAGGYGGCGAIELLVSHPHVRIAALLDKQEQDVTEAEFLDMIERIPLEPNIEVLN